MKAGLGVAAVIAAAAVLVVLVAGAPASEADRLEERFTATSCQGIGSTRETLDSNGLQSWMEFQRQGPRFDRYVERTEPELTVIACKDSGPAVRYFEFANRDDLLGAERAYREDRRFCVLDNALFDVLGAARGHLPDFCDQLDGQLR